MKTKKTIFIVDDHPIVHQGLAELINHEQDLAVCGHAEDANQAMAEIKKLNPSMVIVDISLRKKNGMELIKDIKAQYPALPILTLSMHDETLYAERALRAGARGYIMKAEATENVITAIRRVLDNKLYVSERIADRLMHRMVGSRPQAGSSPLDCLSDRELEVLLLIGQGHGTRQIAEKLYLSIKTIETYRAHIKEKLNLTNAAELLRYSIQWANSGNKV
ncbi:MAG TPA: response regulator transcription factor [Sedimentisphaerales bacterium]|nr:response regulator transcription factor [Sedimentisphaerales bacterium]